MRRSILWLAAPAVLAVGACDIPTEAPRWEQEWQVPVAVDSLDVGVDELLPASVRVSDDGTAFVTTVPGVTARFSLATMCGPCAGISGSTPVKPAFEDTLTTSTPLPAGVVSASVSGGRLAVEVSHSFDFDPLRPSADPAAERGFMVVRVTSGGATLARDSISGNDHAFPAGVVLRPALDVVPGEVTGDVVVELRIYSPEGDGTTLSAADELVIVLDESEVELSEATVNVPDQSVGPLSQTVALQVDAEIVDRIQSGALLVDVSNDLGVTGPVTLSFLLPGGDVERTVELAAGSYEERLAFSRSDVQEILAQERLEVEVEGSVSAPGGTLTVRPGQAVSFDLALEVVLLIGSTEGGS